MQKGIKQPLVSVCVPTKNRGELLMGALACLLAQTYSAIEIVVCDNASSDDTQKLMERLVKKDSRLRYFRHKTAVSAIDNYNFAIAKARGEFIMLAADDDWWDSTYVATIMAEYKKDVDERVALINTRFAVMDQRGVVVKKQRCSFSNLKGKTLSFKRYIAEGFDGYKANVFFGIHRARCLKAVGGYKKMSVLAAGDILTVAEIAKRWEVRIIPKKLFRKREFYLSGRKPVWTDVLAPLFQLVQSVQNVLTLSHLKYVLKQVMIHFGFLRQLDGSLSTLWWAGVSALRVGVHLLPNPVENLKQRNVSFFGAE